MDIPEFLIKQTSLPFLIEENTQSRNVFVTENDGGAVILAFEREFILNMLPNIPENLV